jgi:hypothetical protein
LSFLSTPNTTASATMNRRNRQFGGWDRIFLTTLSGDQWKTLHRQHNEAGLKLTNRVGPLGSRIRFSLRGATCMAVLGGMFLQYLRGLQNPLIVEACATINVDRTALMIIEGCLWGLAGLILHFAVPRELSLSRARRAVFPTAALAGRRSAARIETFAASHETWLNQWKAIGRQPSVLGRWFGSGLLYDPWAGPITMVVLMIVSVAPLMTRWSAILPVWGTAFFGVVAIIGTYRLAWIRSARRLLPAAVACIEEKQCPSCGYDLSGVRPALEGAGSSLGPAVCHECGVDWPMVVPRPALTAEELKSLEPKPNDPADLAQPSAKKVRAPLEME